MEQNLHAIWNRCLQFIKDNLNGLENVETKEKNERNFHLLFDSVVPVSLIDNNLTLSVPSNFYREYIEEHYLSLLAVALKKNIGKGVKLWYSVGMPVEQQVKEKPQSHQNKVNVEVSQSTQSVIPPNISKKINNPLAAIGINRMNIDSNLNPVHSFESFIEGDSNKFAASAARAIASRPGQTSFNPLFLHGGVGVGKTHLAQAIGLEVKNKYPEKIVVYTSSEKFIQQFIVAANSKSIDKRSEFMNFYQMVDVLIIDDIQFLSGKRSTQDTFFHIFDHLHQNGKQIILTSDKAPADIMDIQERIVSRFKWGLSAEMNAPDFNTRKKITIDKLNRDGIILEDDMIDFLANEVNSNVRELIGVINSVIAYSTIYRSDLTLDLLKETIAKISNHQKKEINIPYIQEVVCEYFGIKREQLISKNRKREIALPRQLAMYFSRELANATYSKIGAETGGRDHATVMHACNTVINDSQTDRQIKKYIKDLTDRIKK